MKKPAKRKVIKLVSTIEVPGFPLPMILVHGLEAQALLGEQMIQGVAPVDGEGRPHRLLAFTVTQRFEDSLSSKCYYLAHLLYERGHLLEVQIAEDFGAILMAVLWAKSGTRADADAALKARAEAAYRLEAENADRLAAATLAVDALEGRVEALQRERAEAQNWREQVTALQRQVATISTARTQALTRAQQAETALLAARAELLAGIQDQARADTTPSSPPAPQPSLFLAASSGETATLTRTGAVRRTTFLPGPRPAPTPPAPPEGTRFSLLEID